MTEQALVQLQMTWCSTVMGSSVNTVWWNTVTTWQRLHQWLRWPCRHFGQQS